MIRAVEGILAPLGWCRERCFPIACEMHIEVASGLLRDGMRPGAGADPAARRPRWPRCRQVARSRRAVRWPSTSAPGLHHQGQDFAGAHEAFLTDEVATGTPTVGLGARPGRTGRAHPGSTQPPWECSLRSGTLGV